MRELDRVVQVGVYSITTLYIRIAHEMREGINQGGFAFKYIHYYYIKKKRFRDEEDAGAAQIFPSLITQIELSLNRDHVIDDTLTMTRILQKFVLLGGLLQVSCQPA